MNITRRLKSFTALALSLCMGLQFYPVLGEETTEPVTTDLSTSTSVDWALNTYTARNDGTAFSLGLTFVEGTVLHAGDTMSLALPEGYSFSDITEALPLYAVRNGVPGELLGSYTISGNVLSLVFNEVTDLTGVTTEITVTGTETQPVTEGYYKEQTWTMEQDEDGTVNTVTFTVPSSDIMNWTWVSEDGTWSTTVDSIQETTDGTTLVLSNTATAVSAYTFTLPEGIKADNASAELTYAPANPDGTRSEQSISVGTYNVTDNTLSANVTTVPSEAFTVSLPFTWNTEPQLAPTPEVVDEELVEAITQENEKLNETPAPTTSPVTTATPETTETPEVTPTPEATETPTPEPTETPAANNEINMMAEGRAKPGDKVNYTAWTPSIAYNGVSNIQDIYWIDNSNGEETRPTIDAFKELLNTENNDKLTLTGVQNDGTEVTLYGKSISLTVDGEQVVVPLETWKMNITDLGGTGHWNFNINDLPSQITLTRKFDEVTGVDENNNPTSYTERTETVTITLSDWQIDPTVTSIDEQGNQTTESIDPIPGTDTSTGYSFVNVFDDPLTTDVDYVDQNGRPRPGAASLGEGWYFVQETDYQADIVLRRGNNVLSTADDVDTLINTIKNVYTFYYDTGFPSDQPGALSGKLSLASDVYVDVKREGFAEAESVPTLTFTIRDLEKYNLDGSEIIYDIDQTTTEDDTNSNKSNVINATNFHVFNDQNGKYYGDYFSEEINNDPVSNHGTDITKCYDGGTIYLTLTGETNYQATKIWQDKYAQANNQLRPEVKFELWRYTVTKGTNLNTAYQHASPVQATVDRNSGGTAANSLQTATDVLEGAVASDDVDYSIDFKPDFVMGPVSSEDYKKTVNYLPKYDPEGNSYVYFARETMSGDNANKYRVEYGSLDENGKFTGDKLPDGMTGGRPSGDTGIYNGGTVSNVLNDTTQATVRKTWIADAFQSELGDVDVVLTLQRSSNNGQHWENVTKADGTDLTYTMGKYDVPFSAENLIQEHSESVPTYDNEGNELIYRWVETAIKQNDQEIKINDGEFVLHQNGQDVTYNSYIQDIEREERVTSIINQIDDKTQYHVTKEWEGFPERFDAPPISLVMYRSNSVNEREKLLVKDGDTISENTYFQLDGEIDENPTELYVKNPDYDPKDLESDEYIRGGYVQEKDPWYAEFTDLDLYDVGGSPFDYIVLEGNTGQNWSADYSMDVIQVDGEDVVRMTIVNRPVGGSEIYVRKRWLDDGDEQHRGDVTMTAYAINFSESVDENNFTFANLTKLDDAILNRDNNWWDRIGIPRKSGTEADPEFYKNEEIIVLETKIADAKPGEAGAGAADTNLGEEMYTAEQLHKIYDDQHPKTENEDHAWVQYRTRFHEYEATFSMEVLEDVSFYTVTNRRLGNINLTVTKNWVDGATGTNVSEQRNAFIKALNDKGYDLVMQLVASDTQDFDVVAPEIGENSIHLVHEDVPIRKPKNPNDLTQGYEQTTSVQVVDHKNNSSKYYFWNLPKYNENGKIVRYTVREMAQNRNTKELVSLNKVIQDNQISCEYVFDMAQTSYVTSDSLQPDDQQMDATNRLSGTKRVFFWKEWNDAYRLQNKQRPDIYLDLYQSVKGTNTISGLYRQGSWTFYNDPDITFFDYGYLDKYDEQGREYIYYAKESMNLANASQFDYQPVDYKYLESLEDPSQSEDENIDNVIKDLEGMSSIGDEAGYALSLSEEGKIDSDGNSLLMKNGESGPFLLKEYGVFSNSIQAEVEISGKKIWANVPTGFEDADLIPVTFYIFQYTNGVDDEIIPDAADYLTAAAEGTERFDSKNSGSDTLPYLNGKQAYAWVTVQDWELQKYQGTYAFSIEYVGKNTNDVIQTEDEAEKYVIDDFVNDKYDKNDDGKADLVPGNIVVKPREKDNGVIPADSAYLPKYDDEGNLYTYVLRESGYFGDSDASDDATDGDGREYVFAQPIMNNFAITNAYTPALGELSVRKILDLSDFKNLDDLGDIPAVSFTLTRSYASTDDKSVMVQDEEFSREITFNTTDFEKLENHDNVFVHEYTFENLEIYAPNGNRYEYTITENPKLNDGNHLLQGGYEVFGDEGSHELDVTQKLYPDKGDSEAYSISGLLPKPKEENNGNIVENVINGIGDFFTGIGEFIGITPKQNPSEDDTSWATFKNVYKKTDAQLEFNKNWSDNGQSTGRFATPLTFEVRQWADAQPGQDNAIDTKNTLMGKFTIALKDAAKDKDSVTLTTTDSTDGSISIVKKVDKDENVLNYIHSVTVYVDNPDPNNPQKLSNNPNWKIKVESFQTYAPNGMPWQYQLKEVYVYPYVISNATMEFKYDGTQFMKTSPSGTLTNTSRVTMTATKNITTTADPDADYTAGSSSVWNYTGFDVRVNFDVYATFVQADSWDEAMAKMLANPASGDTNTKWVNLRTDTGAQYRDELVAAMNNSSAPEEGKNPEFTASVTFTRNESFGKKSVSYSNLPKVFDSANGPVYASYILMETSIEMLDGSKVVYREDMTPSFVKTTVPDDLKCSSNAYKAGEDVIAYYYPSINASILTKNSSGTESMTPTQYLFMDPVFDSKDDVVKFEEGYQIHDFNFQQYEEWLPYVWIGKYDSNDAGKNTFINDEFNSFEAMNIDVSKTWIDDNGNIYDTRVDQDKDDKWEVEYQLEVKTGESEWTKVDLSSPRYQVITDADSEDSAKVSYINLPASGIFKKADGSYVAVIKNSIQYRVRELNTDDNKTPIDAGGTYNDAYKVTYETTNAPDNDPLTLKINNKLITINADATKKWDDWGIEGADKVLTSKVTFELQYQSDTDADKDGTDDWKSFDTPAVVELDGIPATEDEKKVKPYYEDTAWHAIWKDIPKVMPGSSITVEGANKKTNYRVIEVSKDNNVYGRYVTDTSSKILSGSGKKGDEYVLQDVTQTGSTDLSYEITNALTVFDLKKTVLKPSGATLTDKSNEEFTFTISPANSIPSSAQYLKYDASGNASQEGIKQFSGTVTLKDGEYVKIFGLQKNVNYTVTESVEGKNFSYAVTYALQSLNSQDPQNTNQVTLPEKESENVKFQTPIMEVTNTVLGSVTITKEDLNGNKLEGISFELQYRAIGDDGNEVWLPAEYWNGNNWVSPEINQETSDDKGIVKFSNLKVFEFVDYSYIPIQYRLIEVAAPGYHKYPEPIEFQLPYAPKDKDQTNEGSNAFYMIGTGEDAVSYYPEVTMTIENDKAFIMPDTSGTGFFWPGMIGVAVSVLSAGGYVVTRKKKKREEENEEVN